jgi:hypothetical protein
MEFIALSIVTAPVVVELQVFSKVCALRNLRE